MFVGPSFIPKRRAVQIKRWHKGTYHPSGSLSSASQHRPGGDNEWSDLSRRLGRRDHVHSLVPRTSLMTPRVMTEQPADCSPNTDLAPPGPTYLHWSPILAGAIVAAAVSFVLLSFGSGIGLAVASPSSTWRDTSAALALVGGLWLLLTSLASFGLGGYLAGRLREFLERHDARCSRISRWNSRPSGLGSRDHHRNLPRALRRENGCRTNRLDGPDGPDGSDRRTPPGI